MQKVSAQSLHNLQKIRMFEGSGEWKDGTWSVVFLRDMPKTGKWDVDFAKRIDPGLMAFAVWDGVKEDRNGRKVISVWQRFNIIKPK